MKRKTDLPALLFAFFLAVCVPMEAVAADSHSREAVTTVELPTLIQATSFESDYRGRVYLGLTATRAQQKTDLDEAFQNILCSCVRVQVEGHYGSGSIYRLLEDEVILVTNRHVLQYWNEDSYITFVNGRVAKGQLLGISETADVGFVSVPVSSFTYEELAAFRNVRSSARDIQDEESAGLLSGAPLLLVDAATDVWNPAMYEGTVIEPKRYIEDFGMEMLYGNGFARGGMSGSGVFDGYGNYLGMLTGGTEREEIAAVPADVIEACYEELVF